MWIEEITLEGFKSYQSRTYVGKFSSKFNAITGLNGSGKSNILDCICFVMGIKSLAQLRVNKLDELVYKQGQAGTTKASVTLVFNNEDKDSSPPMFRDKDHLAVTRQIVIGGRDRYLLNGHNAKPSDIQNLFMSVQLNINNPHFLIMQGRITKVINMKPKDLLSLVEEAAGTRMYEAKRNESARKIARKQIKLDEIQKVLEQEIEPTLQTLRQERIDYNRWSALGRQLEEKQRLVSVFAYYRESKLLTTAKSDFDAGNHKLQELELKMKGHEEALAIIDQQIESYQQEASKHQNPIQEARARKKVAEKERAVAKAAFQEAEKHLAKLVEQERKEKESIKQAEAEMNELKQRSGTAAALEKQTELESQLALQTAELEKAEALLEALKTGKEASGEEGSSSLRSQLIETKSQLTAIEGELKTLSLAIKKWKVELNQLRLKQKGQNKISSALSDELREREMKVSSLSEQLSSVHFDSDAYNALKEELNLIDRELNERNDMEQSKFTILKQSLDIHRRYSLEEVSGPIFELFRIKEGHRNFSLALEECAKMKLFHLVVRDDTVGQQVLDSSAHRITCIPLNKIKGNDPPTAKVKAAQRLLNLSDTDYSVCVPRSVIEPASERFETALNFAFGSAILCTTSEIAKKVSQEPSIRCFAITKDGDTYNPQGTVSGGSQAGLNGLLTSFAEYLDLRSQQSSLQDRKRNIEKRVSELTETAERYDQVQAQLEAEKIALHGVQDRLKLSSEQGEAGLIETFVKKIEEGEKKIAEDSEKKTALTSRIAQLDNDLKNFHANKKDMTNRLKKEVETAKKTIKAVETQLKNHSESLRDTKERLDILSQQLSDSMGTNETLKDQIKSAQSEVEKNRLHLSQTEEKCTKLEEETKTAEEALQQQSAELQQLCKQKTKKDQQKCSLEAQMRKMQHDVKNLCKTASEREKKLSTLERQNPWVKDELNLMISSGTTFTMKGTVDELRAELSELEKERSSLQKKINKKVINMLELAEKEFADLKEKRERVINDKDCIEAFIKDLDEKKAQALQSCWREVNEHFGGIFASLLPTANARLFQLEGCPLDDGLEMKVSFGGVWKDSLSELSGGQRSLLALSLILALLKYKPAPLYILDEVDAALDLSHTQNIGHMIREHFKDSQFIVVSLKENLFSYADVLFRTAFVEGISTIQRSSNIQSQRKGA